MGCTEIAYLPLKTGVNVKDANSQAGAIWQDTLNTVLGQSGAQRAYFGTQVEDPSLLMLFVDWDSLEDHQRFINQSYYKPFVDKFLQIVEAPALFHAHLTPHPPSAVLSDTSSPVTEFVAVHLNPTADRAKTEERVKKFVTEIEAKAEGNTASAGGWLVEEKPLPKDESTQALVYVLLLGWTSVDAHNAYRQTQSFKDNVGLLRELPDLLEIQLVHVPLYEVQPGPDGEGIGESGINAQDAQEEILNPQQAGSGGVKSRADGTTTKNHPAVGEVANSHQKQRQGRGGETGYHHSGGPNTR